MSSTVRITVTDIHGRTHIFPTASASSAQNGLLTIGSGRTVSAFPYQAILRYDVDLPDDQTELEITSDNELSA